MKGAINGYAVECGYNERGLKFLCSRRVSKAVKRNVIKRRIRHIMREYGIKGLYFSIKGPKGDISVSLSFEGLKAFISEYASELGGVRKQT